MTKAAEYTKKYALARPDYGKATRRLAYLKKKLVDMEDKLADVEFTSKLSVLKLESMRAKLDFYRTQIPVAESESDKAREKYGISRKGSKQISPRVSPSRSQGELTSRAISPIPEVIAETVAPEVIPVVIAETAELPVE